MIERPGAAFFDLDHTLLARSSGELYVRALKEQGLLGWWDLARILACVALYRVNLLDPVSVMARFGVRYRGVPEREVRSFCETWFRQSIRGNLYAQGVRRIREHAAQGRAVALLTAATPYVAGPVGRFLGISSVLCTRLEVVDGRFTGSFVQPVCHGKGKLYWARRFCDEQGLDLSRSYFYTDSIRDLPTLEAVGYPRPVNPDRSLLREARRRGWPVERFRGVLGDQQQG
ncbi:MAG: HAD family hydrolase [bacterium]